MRVRRYTPADEREVRGIFRDTIALGRPLPFRPPPGGDSWGEPCGPWGDPWLTDYERLCLSWFVGPGSADAGVLDDGRAVRGYVLVCTNLAAYRRWATQAAASWTARTLARLAAGRMDPVVERFHRLRLRDGWRSLAAPPAPMPAYVHVNVAAEARAGVAGLLLARYADERCRAHGLPGWYGEVNAPVGRRAAALASGGIQTVHRQTSHTLSWLAGEPVERLTVVRDVSRPLRRRASAPARVHAPLAG